MSDKVGKISFSIATAFLFLGLALLLHDHRPVSSALPSQVAARLAASGIANPTTLVLLNVRGYDTLLELGVLLLAVIGMRALALPTIVAINLPSNDILLTLGRVLLPLLVLTAGYLLWIGSKAPGGAFQAGALLGAAGVLQVLVGTPPRFLWSPWLTRLLLVCGFLAFLSLATGLLAGGAFLEYPASGAGELVLLVETAAAISIGTALATLFAGGRPHPERVPPR